MTAKNALRAGLLATALSVGLVLLGSPASASASGSVPEPVVAWFAQDAARVAADVLETRAIGLDAGRSGGNYTAGAPVRLHDWNPAFVAGASAETVTARQEWVAPLYRDGQIVGTIAAILAPDGKVAFSYADDDAAAGKALAVREAGGKVVQDLRMGGLVDLRPDGKARGLSTLAATMVERVNGPADLRTAIHKAHQQGPLEVGEGAAGAPASGGGGNVPLGLALALAGLVLWFAWRRTPAHA